MRILLQEVVWQLSQSHRHQFHQRQKGLNSILVFDFSGELSPMSQVSDSETKPKRKRSKATNSVLSLNDNLYATYYYYILII